MDPVHQSFAAHAFHPSFGNEVIEGRILFRGAMLRFESADTLLEIPLVRLVTELGEDDDERIFFSDPQQPGLRIIALDSSLLQWRASPQVVQIREQLSARLSRHELLRRTKIVLGVLGVCVLLAWLGMLVTSAMVRSIVARAPPEWEQQLGEEMMVELRDNMRFLEDTNRVGKLTALADPLLRTLPGGAAAYRFEIAEDEAPNAFAVPGGHIVITTGMLELAGRPEELLGTIAHEVAHVTQKHGLRTMISSAGPFLVIQVFLSGRSGALGALAGASALLVNQSFSQEYEIEADDVGWRYLVEANIDPRGMTDLFRKLRTYEKKQRIVNTIPQAFNSHPATDKRIARLEAKWQKLPNKSRFITLPQPDPERQ